MAYIKGNGQNLILVRGVSGSGKSTFAEEFLYPTSLIISTDDFFMNDGNYEFNSEFLSDNHKKCIDSVEDYMKDNYNYEAISNIVVHNTFTMAWEIEPYKELADKHGYNFFTIIVENRHKSTSIHEVPEDIVLKQRERFEVVL